MNDFKDSRPPAPGNTQEDSTLYSKDNPVEKFNQVEQKIQKTLQRRYIPSFRSILPKFLSKRLPSLPPELKERWRNTFILFKRPLIIIGICIFAAISISLLTQATIFEPSNGKEVMELVSDPEDISFSVETVRKKKIDGVILRQDSLRGIEYDLTNNKIQAQTIGLGEATLRYVGDGKTIIVQQENGQPHKLNVYPKKENIRPLLPSDIKKNATELLDNKFSVANQRGWFINWNPTKEDILRLLSVNLFSLDGDDIQAIKAGKYKIAYATATIVRSTKQLYQIDIVLDVNQAQLHILATYRDTNSQQLKDLDLERKEIEETS